MKKYIAVTFLLAFSFAYGQKAPTVLKTKFSKEALAQKLQDEDGKSLSMQQIFNKYKGKVLVLDLWAGWCRDCLEVMPEVHDLQEKNPDVQFLFLSLDRTKDSFDKNLEKYNLKDKENYWFADGWKNNFNNYIDLNWIPRYLIVDQKDNIAKYYAITPKDPEIQLTLNKLLKK